MKDIRYNVYIYVGFKGQIKMLKRPGRDIELFISYNISFLSSAAKIDLSTSKILSFTVLVIFVFFCIAMNTFLLLKKMKEYGRAKP